MSCNHNDEPPSPATAVLVPLPPSDQRKQEQLQNQAEKISSSASPANATSTSTTKQVFRYSSHPRVIRPKRPRSAYNMFFKEERNKMLLDVGEIPSENEDDDPNFRFQVRIKGNELEEKERQIDQTMESNNSRGTIAAETVTSANNTSTINDTKRKRGRPRGPNYRPRKAAKRHGVFSFAQLGKIIGPKWKTLDKESKQPYQGRAAAELVKYRHAMAIYADTVATFQQKEKEERRPESKRINACSSTISRRQNHSNKINRNQNNNNARVKRILLRNDSLSESTAGGTNNIIKSEGQASPPGSASSVTSSLSKISRFTMGRLSSSVPSSTQHEELPITENSTTQSSENSFDGDNEGEELSGEGMSTSDSIFNNEGRASPGSASSVTSSFSKISRSISTTSAATTNVGRVSSSATSSTQHEELPNTENSTTQSSENSVHGDNEGEVLTGEGTSTSDTVTHSNSDDTGIQYRKSGRACPSSPGRNYKHVRTDTSAICRSTSTKQEQANRTRSLEESIPHSSPRDTALMTFAQASAWFMTSTNAVHKAQDKISDRASQLSMDTESSSNSQQPVDCITTTMIAFQKEQQPQVARRDTVEKVKNEKARLGEEAAHTSSWMQQHPTLGHNHNGRKGNGSHGRGDNSSRNTSAQHQQKPSSHSTKMSSNCGKNKASPLMSAYMDSISLCEKTARKLYRQQKRQLLEQSQNRAEEHNAVHAITSLSVNQQRDTMITDDATKSSTSCNSEMAHTPEDPENYQQICDSVPTASLLLKQDPFIASPSSSFSSSGDSAP